MDADVRRTYLAALAVGYGVLLAFFVFHWLAIAPIWRVLAEGAIGVPLAALPVAWAWRLSRRARRFEDAWGGLAFGAVFVGGLVVNLAIGRWIGPIPDPQEFGEIVRALPNVLVAPALVAGGGAWLTRGWRGAVAYGLSALVLLLYLGGSIVQRGGEGLGLALWMLLAPSYLAAGAALAWLGREPRGLA